MNDYIVKSVIVSVTVSLIELKTIRKSDIDFLYEILSERSPIENISHKEIPSYRKHVKFVLSKPYKKWYIIYYKKQKFGSLYLTNLNEIGIHFKKISISDFLITKSIDLLINKNPGKRFLINVSPNNKKFIKTIKRKFELIQHTYELQFSK